MAQLIVDTPVLTRGDAI